MIELVRNAPRPGSPEWRSMITASKVAPLLGHSRFTSQFSCWHEMAGNVEPPEFDEDLFAWGHAAELSLAEWWKFKNPGWLLNAAGNGGKTEIAYRNTDLPFPNLVTLDRRALNRKAGPTSPDRFWIVECKTAQTLDSWGYPGEDNAVPLDYYEQVLFQMGVSGIHQASVVVLGPHGFPEIHDVDWSPERFDIMVEKLAEMYDSLEKGIPPELDNSVSSYETLRGLHPEIDREKSVTVPLQQGVAWLDSITGEDEAKAVARQAKIEIAEIMEDARLLLVGDVKLADRRARKGGTPYVQVNKKADLGGDS
ncbi:YqaJ viral recombinase family protein [Corynebacterium phocae]|uniref:YqaJ viral recombinase family protein n=1 Tax=Corynebacterium phocae TaxID=161895 RepID=UPI0009525F55|nr:YqaJ viral recombinase family protein [Corynebacterium phocae]KAA8723021.1 YqaJ viral recombinase family protein [Corynebacterium phocae]